MSTTAAPLTSKHRTTFSVFSTSDPHGDDRVVFKQNVDDGDEAHALVMLGSTFRELGAPGVITVTVEPGDLLNVERDVESYPFVQPDNASGR